MLLLSRKYKLKLERSEGRKNKTLKAMIIHGRNKTIQLNEHGPMKVRGDYPSRPGPKGDLCHETPVGRE